MLANRTKQPRC